MLQGTSSFTSGRAEIGCRVPKTLNPGCRVRALGLGWLRGFGQVYIASVHLFQAFCRDPSERGRLSTQKHAGVMQRLCGHVGFIGQKCTVKWKSLITTK